MLQKNALFLFAKKKNRGKYRSKYYHSGQSKFTMKNTYFSSNQFLLGQASSEAPSTNIIPNQQKLPFPSADTCVRMVGSSSSSPAIIY